MANVYEVTGLDAIGFKLAKLGPQYAAAARELVADTVLFAEKEIANQITTMEAVDTGAMCDDFDLGVGTSISSNGMEAVVATNKVYAEPVHDGYDHYKSGKHIEGRPFVEEAMSTVEEHFNQMADQLIGGIE